MKWLKYIFIKHPATKLGKGTTMATHRPKEVYFHKYKDSNFNAILLILLL
jgi:hypothetical protein